MLIKKRLKVNIKPNWNFGPYKKNCKKVKELTKYLIKNINTKIKIKIKNNKKFHESNLLSLNISKSHKELGWYPTLNFQETIKLTSSWYDAYLKKEDLEKITHNQIKTFTAKMNIEKK